MKDFIPSRLAVFRTWLANYVSRVVADATSLGISAGQSTTLQGLATSFESAYVAAAEPSTRTKSAVATRNLAMKLVKANARLLAKIIQANPAVTPAQKIDLGLSPRDVEPTPSGIPQEQPVLTITKAIGRSIYLQLRSTDTTRRGKPPGVAGATIMSYVGTTPPASADGWRFDGNTTRTNVRVDFAPTVPAGSQVWLAAFWYSPRGFSGLACQPVPAYLAGGLQMSA